MEHYVGLHVPLKLTAICIADRTGRIEREGVVSSEPEAIAAFVRSEAPHFELIGLETGPTATWPWTELNKAGAAGRLYRCQAREVGIKDADQQERPVCARPNPSFSACERTKNKILSAYDPMLQAFLRHVLAHYVKEGVSELDQAKLPILLELKYRGVEKAAAQLGGAVRISDAFIGFQRHLYD